jgi:hypothetical protein
VSVAGLITLATGWYFSMRDRYASGMPDQWMRARSLSVRVSFKKDTLEIRNDGRETRPIVPMTVRGWFRPSGTKETTWGRGGYTRMVQDELKPGSTAMITGLVMLVDPPPLSGPGDLFRRNRNADEVLEKLQIEFGSAFSKEVFIVEQLRAHD